MQNDFEKQVRGKMDELHFQPTEPVWSRIEVQIRRKKDRRRLLWLPVLFVLLAGGGWWWYNSTSDNNIADSAVTPSLSNHENKNVHPDVTGKSSAAGSDITLSEKPEPAETGNYSLPPVGQEKNTTNNVNSISQTTTSSSIKSTRQASKRPISSSELQSNSGPVSSAEQVKKYPNKNKPVAMPVEQVPVSGTEKQVTQPEQQAPQQELPGIKNEIKQAEKIPAEEKLDTEEKLDSVAATPQPEKQKPLKKSNAWKLAVVMQAGVSGLGQGLSLGMEKESMDQLTAGQPSPITNANQQAAEIKPGASFAAGVAVRKQLRDRLYVSAGLGYHYYSNTITVGNDSVSMSNGIRYFSAASSATTSNAYKNNYHFISLPLTVSWRVFRHVPLQLEGGFSLQQLVSTNALVHNRPYNLYMEDRSAINRTQLFTQAGLHYELKLKNNSLLLGPQVQYGLSKLEKNNNNKHLYGLGFKAQWNF